MVEVSLCGCIILPRPVAVIGFETTPRNGATETAYVTETTSSLRSPSFGINGTKTGRDILLGKMGTNGGKVVSACEGGAIAGVTVAVTGSSNWASTESAGWCTLNQDVGTEALAGSETEGVTATGRRLSVTNNKITEIPNFPLMQTVANGTDFMIGLPGLRVVNAAKSGCQTIFSDHDVSRGA